MGRPQVLPAPRRGVMALTSDSTKYDELLRSSTDEEEMMAPAEVKAADEETEYKCKDVFLALVFLSGVAAMIAGLAGNMDGLEKEWKNEVTGIQNKLSALTATKMLGTCAGVAVVFATIWLLFVRYCVQCAVYGLFTLTIAAEVAGAAALFYFANSMDEATGWAILANTTHDAFWVACGLCLMGYWGLEVLSNIVLVASYGTLGEWYYKGTPVVAAPLARATTVHFGSVCFGSLLVAMVETAHDVIDVMAKKGYFPECAMCCVDRVMAGIKATFEYINKYGFVQVAVHDEPFFQASKRAMSFLKYKGLTALMNDSIVATLAHVGAVAGGLLAGVVPVLLQRQANHEDVSYVGLSGDQETALALSGFVLGSFIVYTLISPFPAFVTALLVCFAEHPEVLAERHAEEYRAMIAPWEGVYGQDFVDKAATRANLDAEAAVGTTNGLLAGRVNPLAEELEKIVTMRNNGALSEEEFTLAKAQLLG